MAQGRRFTAWLTDEERQALEDEANRNGTTINFIVRVCVREHFAMSTPRIERMPVTAVTRNK